MGFLYGGVFLPFRGCLTARSTTHREKQLRADFITAAGCVSAGRSFTSFHLFISIKMGADKKQNKRCAACDDADGVHTRNKLLQSSLGSGPRPPLQAVQSSVVWSASEVSASVQTDPKNRTKKVNALGVDSTGLNEGGVNATLVSLQSFKHNVSELLTTVCSCTNV